MADYHISQLTTLNTPNDDDTFIINDNTSGSPTTKSISFKNLKIEIQSQNIGAGLEFDSQGRYTVSLGDGLEFEDSTTDANIKLDIGAGLRFSSNTVVVDINNDSLKFYGNNDVGVRLRDGGGLNIGSFNLPDAGLYVEWDRLIFVRNTVPNNQTDPTTPFEKGRLWVNTSPTTPELKVWDGNSWEDAAISVNTLKEIVDVSTDFDNFKTLIAGL
jgi:hypothetical protein